MADPNHSASIWPVADLPRGDHERAGGTFDPADNARLIVGLDWRPLAVSYCLLPPAAVADG